MRHTVRGTVADGFEAVGRAFEEVAAGGAPMALHVRRDGRTVVDLASGQASDGRPFTSERPVYVYSAVKAVVGLAAVAAVADGRLDLDAPVSRWWPEFAAHGKHDVSVRQALAHAAAVPGWGRTVRLADLADWDAACALLAGQEPRWPAGEPGEHVYTYGHLVGELVRRATGRALARWWRERLAGRLDLPITFRPSAAPDQPAPVEDPDGRWFHEVSRREGLVGQLLCNPDDLLRADVVNGDLVARCPVPAVTGYASASALSRLYEVWCGAEVAAELGEGLRDETLTPQSSGEDHVLGREVAWGLGPQLDPDSLGMGGIGGCAGWYERPSGLAVGFTTSRLGGDAGTGPLDDALVAVR